jgi:hypothetical protein
MAGSVVLTLLSRFVLRLAVNEHAAASANLPTRQINRRQQCATLPSLFLRFTGRMPHEIRFIIHILFHKHVSGAGRLL